MNAIWIGSPNFQPGRGSKKVNKIVIHWMAGNLASTDRVFQDTARKTSAHYGIENEVVHQYVKEENTAYHAGVFEVNQESIGIENSAQPGRDASELTYKTLVTICTDICKRYNLDESSIHPHNEYVPTQCPGTIDLGYIREGVKNNLKGINKMTQDAIEKLVSQTYRAVTDVDPTQEQAAYWVERIRDDNNRASELPAALGGNSYQGDPQFRLKARNYDKDLAAVSGGYKKVDVFIKEKE